MHHITLTLMKLNTDMSYATLHWTACTPHHYTPIALSSYNLSHLLSHPTPLITWSRACCIFATPNTPSPLSSLTPTPLLLLPHAAQCIHRCSSSSSSDTTPQTPATTVIMPPAIDPLYAPVEVCQSAPSTAPILSAGHLQYLMDQLYSKMINGALFYKISVCCKYEYMVFRGHIQAIRIPNMKPIPPEPTEKSWCLWCTNEWCCHINYFWATYTWDRKSVV